MGKSSKLLSLVLLVLGFACIGAYFVFPAESNEFKVVFDSQGGTAVSEKIVKKGEKVDRPEDPTKDNAQFVEWQLDGVAYIFDDPVIKNITLVAKWNDVVLHNVTVNIDGQGYTASISDGSNLTIDVLNIPPKDGYNVKLYNENNEEYDMSQPVTGDLILTGKYVEIKTYTVKFDSQGAGKVNSQKVTDGSQATEPTVSRDGYTLDGWYLGNEKFDFGTAIAKDITLKARWTENGKINVIFMADDKVYKTIAVKENSKVTKPANPTKKGNKFVEWQLNGSAFDFNTKITEETTLTAVFEEVNTYKVTFNSDGGSKVSDQEVEVGKKATKPADPTKSGYVFKEWQLNGSTYDFNKEVNDDLALKAVWEVEQKQWTVKFVDDDGKELAKSQTVLDGEKAAKPVDPKKDGYTFDGWLLSGGDYDFSQPVKSDIKLTARFVKIPEATPPASTGDVETTE